MWEAPAVWSLVAVELDRLELIHGVDDYVQKCPEAACRATPPDLIAGYVTGEIAWPRAPATARNSSNWPP